MQRDGDFLVRDSLSSPGNFVLTCQWKNLAQHFKIHRTVLRLSEAYSRVQYQFETESFDSIPGLVRCYVGNRRPISQQSGAIIFQPINRTVPLRCLEERYGASPGRRPDVGKRLSLTMGGVQAREQSSPKGNLLRWVRASWGGVGGALWTCPGSVRQVRSSPRETKEQEKMSLRTPGVTGIAVVRQGVISSPVSRCQDEMRPVRRKGGGLDGRDS